MATPTGILDLPAELLLSILPYLDVNSFLNFTSTCRALHSSEVAHEPSYWSHLVRVTFRVPNQPVVERDGARWQKLYRRMAQQTQCFTWGNNEKGCLGHSNDLQRQDVIGAGGRRVQIRRRPHANWPEVMENATKLGIISDLQCGGWSTTLLTAKGSLCTVGIIDGLKQQRQNSELTFLSYPAGFPRANERYEPATAIREFSSGRSHVLALSDSGRIWSWHDVRKPGLHVKFLHHDTIDNGSAGSLGAVEKVVAGWNKSGALIEGTGIVIWEPLERDNDETSTTDGVLVMDTVVIPNTTYSHAFKRPVRYRGEDPSITETVGEVCNFIILEEVVLFNTKLGKLFASHIWWDEENKRISGPIEVPLLPQEDAEDAFVTDIQGSFKSFAVFTKSGAVLIGKQSVLIDFLQDNLGERPLFSQVPALQHNGVIQIAFGDHHFHALHAPGYITSYGVESQHCGALGLGSSGGEGRLRGLRSQGGGNFFGRGDGRLVPHAYTNGRRIWFEKEKRAWLDFLASGGVDPAECMERVRMALGSPGISCQGEVSEWIEQEGQDWESKLGVERHDDDGLSAYFALSVAAAGWHSGALVLVNEDLSDKMKAACEAPDEPAHSEPEPASNGEGTKRTDDGSAFGFIYGLLGSALAAASDYGRWFLGMSPYSALPPPQANAPTDQRNAFQRNTSPTEYGASPRAGFHYMWANDHFPRLVLSDGTEMPGMVPFEDWRYKRPEWDLDAAL